jgi:DNA-binding transcriptional ArsR family regulator
MNTPYAANTKPPIIEIDFGLAYELLISLMIFREERDFEYEIGNGWFDKVRTRAGTELLASIQQFHVQCNQLWKHLLGLAYESEAPKDVEAFLAYLETVEPLELRLHLIGYYRRSFRRTTPIDVILQAAEGDQEAQRQFLNTTFPDDEDWQTGLRHIFSLDLETTKTTLLHLLHQWYERVFSDQQEPLLPILERDAQAKRALQLTMSPERLIETATNGIAYFPEPGLRRVLLIPSYLQRPWNDSCEYHDLKILCYPVADENVTEDSHVPPARLIRLYKALADERRLRILKMLMTRSYTLQELADEFGVAKTTMHHHLSILRTAGLVLIQPNDHPYSLRHHMLSEVSTLLDSYLKGK